MVIGQTLIKETKKSNNLRVFYQVARVASMAMARVSIHDTCKLFNSKVVCRYWKKVGKHFTSPQELFSKQSFAVVQNVSDVKSFPFRIDMKIRLSNFRGNWVPSYVVDQLICSQA